MAYNFKDEVKLFMIFDILGDTERSGPLQWKIERERLEDVKNHILDLLLITRILRKYFPSNLDYDKITDYIICHDLPEAITGDITKFEGVSNEEIKRGVASIEPVEHRLSMKHTVTGVTILDDAFNSNPDGSRMALEVLKQFTGGKRIVVTPGMVELGNRQFELNEKFGEYIAKSCDIAIVVGHHNREAINRGIEKGEFQGKLYEVDSFNEAQKLVNPMLQTGDTVLYENDLPDSFK